jgi:hypothetical protein
MEEKYEECEAKHEEAIRLITELKSARVGRDLQVNTLERKVSALQEATHVSLPDEESPRV